MTQGSVTGTDGLVVVDKPAGWTSHDVVARLRRLAGTRRVGHAGTLDPMATGVLVVGVGRATRLLGHLALTEKAYDATARFGVRTTTDDAEGEVVSTSSVGDVGDEQIVAAFAALTGEIEQVPPQVSAVKVAGRRAYARARSGEVVELAPRRVRVEAIEVTGIRRPAQAGAPVVDVDFSVRCSSGTYIRSLARDAGAGLGCGAHLTALRRTRVGPFTLEVARTLDQLAESLSVLPLSAAVSAAFPRRDLDERLAGVVAHGGRIPAAGLGPGPIGVFAPDGEALALVEERGELARPVCVFVAGR